MGDFFMHQRFEFRLRRVRHTSQLQAPVAMHRTPELGQNLGVEPGGLGQLSQTGA
jgi:hypothetical protein